MDLILGVETSCDETAAAVVEDGGRILSSVVASQVEVHAPYGGIVPELASRRHLEVILPVLTRALQDAGVGLADLAAVAVTAGPGLVGSLLVGVSAAKALAYCRRLPLVAVNHLEGHIAAARLEWPQIVHPFVALVVSGGHTHLYHVPAECQYRLLGRTRDDAAGEAFDKVAKLLNLGYPGGPLIEREAARGNPRAIPFPRSACSDGSLDFSFSGFKTAALRHIELAGIQPHRSGRKVTQKILDLVASYQQVIVDTLVSQTRKAVERHHPRSILLVGGVACNSLLRRAIKAAFEEKENGCPVYYPSPILTTDNAAMIAAAGTPKLRRGMAAGLDLNAFADLPLC